MKKLLTQVLFILLTLTLAVPQAFAVTLDTIGASATTSGNPGSEWYYTAENPVLSGTTAVSGTVNITIDDVLYTTTGDTAGNWSYQPTTLTTGDHTVVIADSTSNLSFTIHIGQSAPDTKGGTTASGSSETLPQSGAVENTLFVLIGGGILIFAGIKLSKASAKI